MENGELSPDTLEKVREGDRRATQGLLVPEPPSTSPPARRRLRSASAGRAKTGRGFSKDIESTIRSVVRTVPGTDTQIEDIIVAEML